MKRTALFLIFLSNTYCITANKPSLTATQDSLTQLQATGLTHPQQPIRLHLGCGESHLNGYINIDFPPSEHTVQIRSGADIFGNITSLDFPPESIDEIRSHHIFEHFDRQTALALLCAWHTWLKPGGALVIETPDFEASIKVMLDPRRPYTQQQVALRHIFGSHEAHWAYHYDGWYKAKFEHVLGTLGFSEISSQFLTHNPLIPSILIRAKKSGAIPAEQLAQRGKNILRDSMVDGGDTSMWHVWCQAFDKALHKLGLN